eukprot:Tamp_17001.p2 GENE.Tamp_17001~~Tamp_17001.p2  ORF type:complete len:153 (+),score=34.24 Tamp_17001:893-1351(+)
MLAQMHAHARTRTLYVCTHNTCLYIQSHRHTDAIKGLLIIHPEGVLVSLSVDMVIKVWDYTKGKVLHEIKHEGEDLTCMTYDYSKRNLVCGTEACTIITVDIPTPAKLLRAAMPDGSEIPEDIVGEEGEEAGEGDVVAEVVEEHEPLVDEQP